MTDRYRHGSIRAIWTLPAQYQRWISVWAACGTATGHPLPSSPTLAVDSRVFLGRVEQLEERYGHDVAAVCEALRFWLRSEGADDAARWLHYGLCSSDVVDAGWLLAFASVTEELQKQSILAEIAVNNHAPNVMAVYRTHGRAAQVENAGWRWAGHIAALHSARVQLTEDRPRELGFNGPVGVGGTVGYPRSAVAERLSEFSGERYKLRPRDGRQAASREQWVTWLQSVGRLATVCERFATDVRLLAHEGVDEAVEGRGPEYRGSSSMPHKRNPTRSERICGIAPVVRGLIAGYAEAASSCWGSHSLEHSSAERIVIPQVTELVGFMLAEVTEIARELQWNHVPTAENVRRAPEDSFARRNALIEVGIDGGEAYEAARPGVTADQAAHLDAMAARGMARGPQPDFVLHDEVPDGSFPPIESTEPMIVEVSGRVTPNVSAADRDRGVSTEPESAPPAASEDW